MKQHKLEEYLQTEGESVTNFAKRVGVSRQTIYRVINRHGNFSMSLIGSIVEKTDGFVTPADFFEVAA